MELGIIGLPTSGKTTIFNALARAERPTAAASTGKLELVSGVVDVPDVRIDRLSEMYAPRKTTYAKVTYTDIAGLDQDLGKKGLSGELRNKIGPMEAFVHVVRAFENEHVPHILGSVDPQRDLDRLEGELMLADMLAVETQLDRTQERLDKGARGPERQKLEEDLALFQRLSATLATGEPLRDMALTSEELRRLRGFCLLTLKPVLILVNTGDEQDVGAKPVTFEHQRSEVLALHGQIEMELSRLSQEEVRAFMDEFGIQELALNRVIQASYALIGLHSFFTVGEDEVRAWNLPVGGTALEAAGTIHTDLAKGFIRAEVVAYDDLIEAGSMAAARKAAKVHLEGKDYVVQDGDVLHIRFSV
ncbi:MAG: redox-regulated ATPase YchF [Anaerolineae bacterium]|nr:redox-regulated ATPase YchF [Anaerolineae bacterium]